MHALILSDIPMIQYHTRLALLQRGFMVMAAETNATAGEHVRRWRFDLLIAQERVGGKLTHGVLLSAEKRAHYVKTVLLSDKEGEARDELYDLLPSVASIMPSSTSPDLLAQVGTAAVTGAARALRRRRLPKTTAPLLLLPAHRTDVARPNIQPDEIILRPTG